MKLSPTQARKNQARPKHEKIRPDPPLGLDDFSDEDAQSFRLHENPVKPDEFQKT
jgi:hypothetical protein